MRVAKKATHCSDGIAAACDFLEHYHIEHTSDKVSKFFAENHQADIYVVSDPESRRKFEALLLEECNTISERLQ